VNLKHGVLVVIAIAAVALFTLSAFATDAQMYLSSDKNGQSRVTNIQEGDEVWIVVIDNDENIDCDVRDKIWTDVKIMDPKTGAYIVWMSLPDGVDLDEGWEIWLDDDEAWFDGVLPWKGHWPGNNPGSTLFDYLEETGADTGVFVSKRAFQIGARIDYDIQGLNTHVVDATHSPFGPWPTQFTFGQFRYGAEYQVFAGARGLFIEEDGTFTGFLAGFPWPPYIPPLLEIFDVEDIYSWRELSSYLPWEWWFREAYDDEIMRGCFENMDSLILMYQDQNDPTDVAVGMAKIIDTEATISWDQEIYKDANTSATITVVDPDENLNCNQAEYVPVFIIVNPGSWNPLEGYPNTFCLLKAHGGADPHSGMMFQPIRWYNIYFSGIEAPGLDNNQQDVDGSYYMWYPPLGFPVEEAGSVFDTADDDGYARVMFYAQETGVNTGVFQFNINSILDDLGFNSLDVRDVLVAYYLDPNDDDDFKLSLAYIEEKQHSITSFTDENRADKDLYWIGRDPVYVQVIDSNANVDPCCPEQVVVHICDVHAEDDVEFVILDETSSNSPVFFTHSGMQLWPVWDALGVGVANMEYGTLFGGYQLQLDNWKLEAFNEDDIYARYNDVYYTDEYPFVRTGEAIIQLDRVEPKSGGQNLSGLGDLNLDTAFPPWISRIRVDNDVSFDMMSIADTQVYDGSSANMWFLDRQGNRVSGYVNSDCVFIEVLDPDQDEDQYRRERIDAYWDGGQNIPFGPLALNYFECEFERYWPHPINHLLGDTNIFNDSPEYIHGWEGPEFGVPAKLYILNPRSGRWAAVDLLETGVATGDFVSVICIDLMGVYECVPQLGVIPGDTIVAFYQDPSNHSDSAMISIKVGIGGGGTPPSQQSTTMFVDAEGNEVQLHRRRHGVRESYRSFARWCNVASERG